MLSGPIARTLVAAFGHCSANVTSVIRFVNPLGLLVMCFRSAVEGCSLVMHDHHETLTPNRATGQGYKN